MDPLDLLPMEMWREIALQHPTSWYVLIRVIGGLYRADDRSLLKRRGVEVKHADAGYCWTLYGEKHRDRGEGPAVVEKQYYGETVEYYTRGRLNRRDGPAVITSMEGRVIGEQYYRRGVVHRNPKEGPASWFSGSYSIYYRRGKIHRDPEEGPALLEDGWVEYLVNGKLHRDERDGPSRTFIGNAASKIRDDSHIPRFDRSECPPEETTRVARYIARTVGPSSTEGRVRTTRWESS